MAIEEVVLLSIDWMMAIASSSILSCRPIYSVVGTGRLIEDESLQPLFNKGLSQSLLELSKRLSRKPFEHLSSINRPYRFRLVMMQVSHPAVQTVLGIAGVIHRHKQKNPANLVRRLRG